MLKSAIGPSKFFPRDIHCSSEPELRKATALEDPNGERRHEYQSVAKGRFLVNAEKLNELIGAGPPKSPGTQAPKSPGGGVTPSVGTRSALRGGAAGAAPQRVMLFPLPGAAAGDANSNARGAAIGFAASKGAADALDAYASRALDGLLLKMMGEHFELAGKLAAGTAEALRHALGARDAGECVFALLRFVMADDVRSKHIVVSFSPDSAPVRARVIHSSAMPALRALLAEHGVDVAKSVEAQDLEDLTDEWLAEHAADEPEAPPPEPEPKPTPNGVDWPPPETEVMPGEVTHPKRMED
jgi:hypothetical protein